MDNKRQDGIPNLRKAGGRPKGAENKISREAKDAIAEAAEKLGGVNRLAEWAKEDPKHEFAFWTTIYPKLVAIKLTGTLAASLIIKSGVPRAGN